MTSSGNQPCNRHFEGGEVYLNINDVRKATAPRKFRYFEHCFPSEEIDVVNDRFRLQSSSNDGVCISSLKINGTQILNGRNNNKTAFWLDKNSRSCDNVVDDVQYLMASPYITIQNNQVTSSACKGKFYSKKKLIFQQYDPCVEYECTTVWRLSEVHHCLAS